MRGSLESDLVTPCVVTGQQQQQQQQQQPPRKKRFPGRWSLRHLLYSSPLLNRRRSGGGPGSSASGSSKQIHRAYTSARDSSDGAKLGSSSKTDGAGGDRVTALHHVEIHQATSRTSVYTTSTKSGENATSLECHLCLADVPIDEFWDIAACGHRACIHCLQQYLRVEITESRVCISCPECTEPIHPNEIRSIADDSVLYEKYEDFMVRRVLAVDPDTRWCPAPDCGFAVIASECASCPKLKCERPGCDSYFCYHCKAEWHPNQTCDAARAQRSPNILLRSSSITYSQDSQHRDDIKPCPRCQVLIVKMDDGSCNHMMCAVCGAEFCWLCMKEISDLHYLSPSGCTFWGKKPWSRKKKILWQLGTLVGAPVGIALVAGITVPAMIIGIPVWVGRKLYTRYKMANKHKRNAAIVGGVLASVIISPILAGLAVGIGVPILLFYVYGVVPVSLCRSGGCGGSASNDDSTVASNTNRASQGSGAGAGSSSGAGDSASMADAASAKVPNPSIGEASLSMASGSQVLVRDVDRESASTVALAGSLASSGCATLASGSTGCGGGRLDIQAEVASTSSSTITTAAAHNNVSVGGNQRFSITSLSESGANVSISGGGGQDNDGSASTRALAGSILNYKTSGNDSCTEDGTSERVRFDDNVSFIVSPSGGGNGAHNSQHYEKASIGSSCSFRARCVSGSSSSTVPSGGITGTGTTTSLNFSTNNNTNNNYNNQTASVATATTAPSSSDIVQSTSSANKGGLLSVAGPVLSNDSISIDMLGGVATTGGDQSTLLASHSSTSHSVSPNTVTRQNLQNQITRSSTEDGGNTASNNFNVNTNNVRTIPQFEQQTSGISRKSQAAILRNQFFYSGLVGTATTNPASNDVPPPPPPMPLNDSVVAMTINKAVIEVANEIAPNSRHKV